MKKNLILKQCFVKIFIVIVATLFIKNVTYSKNIDCLNQEINSAYFTPDKKLNIQLKNGQADPVKIFGISDIDGELVINPKLQKNWTWLAARNINYNGEKISFFFYNGWLYTDKNVKTSHRRMKFRKNVSPLIKSNVFVVAFYGEKEIEKELAIFIASDEKVAAELIVNKKLWGEEKTISYQLEAGEGHFISMLKMAEEFRPLLIPEDLKIRSAIDLNQGWKFLKNDIPNFHFKDDDWQSINLPHCWNKNDVFDQRNVLDGYEIYHGYYRGIGWYRKIFSLDSCYFNKKVILEFEGANQVAKVWLNGDFLGEHIGGYTGFKFDITDKVHFGVGKNILAVQVDNRYNYDIPPHTADFIMYGGLYRDVRLKIKNKVFIDNVFITSPEVSETEAIIRTVTKIKNDSEDDLEIIWITNIINNNGEIAATIKDVKKIKSRTKIELNLNTPKIEFPNLWSPDNPNLYKVYCSIYVDRKLIDQVITPFGFRWFHFDAKRGFFLNGKSVKLKGVCKHQDFFGYGNAVPDSIQVQDIKIIKKMGANFIRLSHYPHDPSVLEACDRLGLLVWAEIPLVNSVGGDKFKENALMMMKEMIHRDRNHCSIILWGITNESVMKFAPEDDVHRAILLLQELNALTKNEDPTRLTVQAHNYIHGEELAEITDIIGRNRYFGWYNGEIEDFETEMIKEHRQHPEWKILISEYGVGSKRGHHVDNPKAWDFSEEFQLKFHESYLKVINKYPWLAGGTIWNAFDFGSFVKRGNIPRINQKGLSDMARRPKDVYYFYQSQWSEKPMVYIVSFTQKIITGKKDEIKNVRVFSNCENVELFLNGVSLGKKNISSGFEWQVEFAVGKNLLKAVAQKAGKTVEDQHDLRFTIREDFRNVIK